MNHHQSSQAELFAVQASGQSGDGQDGQWCLVLQHGQERLLQRDFAASRLDVAEQQQQQEEQKKELERQVEQLLIEPVSGRHLSAGRQTKTGRQLQG